MTNSRNIELNSTLAQKETVIHWYVVYTRINCECRTAEMFRKLGFEAYVPVREEIHQWSDRKRKIRKVLIPTMVFIRSSESRIKEVESFSFCYSLMKFPGSRRPVVIPDVQMEMFMRVVESPCDEVDIVPLNVKVGSMVKVISGPLKDMEGVVLTITGGRNSFGIRIDNIGYAVIYLDGVALQPI